MTQQAVQPQMVFQVRGAAQRLFEEWQDHLEIMLDGPVGVAKTMPITYLIHTTCMEYPMARWLVFRKTRVSLNNSFLKTYRDLLTDPRIYLLTEYGEDPPQWAIDEVRAHLHREYGYLMNRKWGSALDEIEYSNGSKIILASMENPTRLRSAEYDAAFCNEGTELTLEEYESVRRSLRNRVLPAHPFILDCNPGPPNHYLLRRVADGRLKRMQSYYDDNPWITGTEGGRAYKEAVRTSYTGHRLRRMYGGEWCGAEGLIWPEYQPVKHDIRGYLEQRDGGWWLVVTKGMKAEEGKPEEIRMRRFMASQDWGFVNPGVQQIWGMDDRGRLFMVQEHYMTGKKIDWWAEVAVANYKKFECHPIVCDPSRPDFIESFNDRLGVPSGRPLARIAIGADNAVDAGIDHVRDRMDDESTIFFLENALAHAPDSQLTGIGENAGGDSRKPHHTTDEFGSYVYKPVDDDKEDKEQPRKVHDHGSDCVRQICMWAWRKQAPGDEFPKKFPEGTPGAQFSSWKHRKRKKR